MKKNFVAFLGKLKDCKMGAIGDIKVRNRDELN
jgi:hypothetical protein